MTRVATSLNLLKETHRKLKELAAIRGTSMSRTIDFLVEVGLIIAEATPSTKEIIDKIVVGVWLNQEKLERKAKNGQD
jgi:hypothetical protein